MNDISVTDLSHLKRDLSLRGYNDTEIEELLQIPILMIPESITFQDSNEPDQKLSSHIALIAKDFQGEGIVAKVVLRRDVPHKYRDECHAHVDLGTIVISLFSIQQLSTFADIAQILDFLLTHIKLRLVARRTKNLMPNVTFDLKIHNGSKIASIKVEGQADEVAKILAPKRIEAMLAPLNGPSTDV